jgi:hypothetical protein
MRRTLVVTVAALVAAAASPAVAAPRQKVAVLDVRAVQGVAAGTATILTAIIAGDTAAAGYDVLSQADIGALLGFERQKKMLGCGDDSSCLAEIGGALGAEYVLSTQVGQIGSRLHLALQLLDARKGLVVSRVSTFSETNEDALTATAQRAVAQALAAAKERTGANGGAAKTKVEPAPAPAATPPSRPAVAAADDAAATRPYAELRAGTGFGRAPIPTSPGVKAFDRLSVGARLGLALSRSWALEAGGSYRKPRHTRATYRYADPSAAITANGFEVLDEVWALSIGAGPVWSPAALRVVSFAADAGGAMVTVEHTRMNPAVTTGGRPWLTERFSGWVPRVGAEVRVDVPVRWVTLGLRAGLDLAKLPGRLTVRDPFVDSAIQVSYLDRGWLVSFPIELAVRYVF